MLFVLRAGGKSNESHSFKISLNRKLFHTRCVPFRTTACIPSTNRACGRLLQRLALKPAWTSCFGETPDLVAARRKARSSGKQRLARQTHSLVACATPGTVLGAYGMLHDSFPRMHLSALPTGARPLRNGCHAPPKSVEG